MVVGFTHVVDIQLHSYFRRAYSVKFIMIDACVCETGHDGTVGTFIYILE